ncbi:uncharacterized protein Fot_13733 [Forsythia ovata]|uniref:PB1 domain-containing protein n=1 Tax=Forsythia ovata TaxID=205694 RepID=A0ABD1W4A1_9LAMI
MDTLLVHSTLQNDRVDNSYFDILIEECRLLAGESPNLKFNWLRRSADQVAHTLAKAASSLHDILSGEDLDALILVTNDDDLEHMMREYDQLYRVSPKTSRLRIFIFHNLNPSSNSSVRSFGSNDAKSEKERFVETLNSKLVMMAPPPVAATAVSPQPPPANNNVDYFFELEKGVGMAPQPLQLMLEKVEVDDHVSGFEERSMGSDLIQQHIRDLERLRIEEQQGAYKRRNDDNLTGGFAGDDYYKVSEKFPPVSIPSGPPGYWPEKQFAGGVFSIEYFQHGTSSVHDAPLVNGEIGEWTSPSELLRSSNDAIGGLLDQQVDFEVS